MDDIFSDIKELSRADALDRLYDTIDELLLSDEPDDFKEIIKIMRSASENVNNVLFPVNFFLSILTITKPCSSFFGYERELLGVLLQQRLIKEFGEQKTNKLLAGIL